MLSSFRFEIRLEIPHVGSSGCCLVVVRGESVAQAGGVPLPLQWSLRPAWELLWLSVAKSLIPVSRQ